ncbi:MAG: DUF3566 domain-containing protein [Bifidobacteriaceae bacterium]|jgi:hypothetical protein|nr:DUF3566 domain-containing protein [Bifidobacteriaceae bacterium]
MAKNSNDKPAKKRRRKQEVSTGEDVESAAPLPPREISSDNDSAVELDDTLLFTPETAEKREISSSDSANPKINYELFAYETESVDAKPQIENTQQPKPQKVLPYADDTAVVLKSPIVNKFTNSFTVTRISPVSALKVGFILSACGAIVFMLAMLALYFLLTLTGIFDKLTSDTGDSSFISTTFNFANLFDFWTVLIVLIALMVIIVIAGTILSCVVALFYNFAAKIFGGISINLHRISVAEMKSKDKSKTAS